MSECDTVYLFDHGYYDNEFDNDNGYDYDYHQKKIKKNHDYLPSEHIAFINTLQLDINVFTRLSTNNFLLVNGDTDNLRTTVIGHQSNGISQDLSMNEYLKECNHNYDDRTIPKSYR